MDLELESVSSESCCKSFCKSAKDKLCGKTVLVPLLFATALCALFLWLVFGERDNFAVQVRTLVNGTKSVASGPEYEVSWNDY